MNLTIDLHYKSLVIDANNLAHRARHAYNLSYKGKDISVTYGVMRMLIALVKRYKPTSVIFCWDGGTPGFRKRLVPSYKSGRKHDADPGWDSFLSQVAELEAILPRTGVLQVRRRGIEADDLMAQAAQMLKGPCLIVSTDDDMLQCVNDNVSVLKPGKKDKIYTIDNFEELVGYPVDKFLMAKVLMGDSSDNIRGVTGIGPARAKTIALAEDMYEAVWPSIQGRLKEFMTSGKYEAAYATMDLSVDRAGARLTLLQAKWQSYSNEVMKWCMDRAFTSILEQGNLGVVFGGLKKPTFKTDLVAPRIWDYQKPYD